MANNICKPDCNPIGIMPIIKYTISEGPFSEDKKFFLEKYEEYMKNHNVPNEKHDEDCVDGRVSNINESVKEMTPLLIRLNISVYNYMEKLEKRIQSLRLRKILYEKSSVIFNAEIFPVFEQEIESNITERVGRELNVIKCFFERVQDVETSNDADEDCEEFLEDIIKTIDCMLEHHSIILRELEMGFDQLDSRITIQEDLIDDEVRFNRYQRHYQLACVASKYFTSLFKDANKVYETVSDSN